MAKQVFEPWFAVKVGARKNRKILALPDDTARLGWFLGVLAEAKLQRPGGRFVSRDQLLESIPGRFADHVDAYIRTGLLHEAPRLCPDCRKEVGPVSAGTLVVHDWRKHQRDPDAPIRAANWRAIHGANGVDDDSENDDETTTERSTNDRRTTDVRPTYAGSTRDVTADSRVHGHEPARALARQETDTETRDRIGSRNGAYPALSDREPIHEQDAPLLTDRALKAWHPYRRQQWAGFKAAWFARGFTLPPQGDPDDPRSQAHIVWEILDARGDELAEWVTEAPGKTSHDVVHHLLERWGRIKADAGVDEDQEPDVERDPTSTPESAKAILEGLFGR